MSKISPLVDDLIQAFQCLPGVGPKSAQRMVLDVLERNREEAKHLAGLLISSLEQVNKCKDCRIFTENEKCNICINEKRDSEVLCIVESVTDVFAIEQSNQFFGKYFVLHGHLSPIDDIGPEEIGLDVLKKNVGLKKIKEIILATNSTLEGQATAHYILDIFKTFDDLRITRLAQGVPLGGELEFVDGGTIQQAFNGRVNLKS
tara:strand:+ start:73563 stop:74171 length:609 start_codon:yes stop_codon:yes gene_type:complete